MLNQFQTTLSLLKRLYDQNMEPVCFKHSITRMELDILLFLVNNPGQDTAKDLVQTRKLTKSHVSAAVNHLIELGLLSRSYTAANRKLAHLSPTDAAAGILRDGRAAQETCAAQMFKDIPDVSIERIQAVLEIIQQNARSALAQ